MSRPSAQSQLVSWVPSAENAVQKDIWRDHVRRYGVCTCRPPTLTLTGTGKSKRGATIVPIRATTETTVPGLTGCVSSNSLPFAKPISQSLERIVRDVTHTNERRASGTKGWMRKNCRKTGSHGKTSPVVQGPTGPTRTTTPSRVATIRTGILLLLLLRCLRLHLPRHLDVFGKMCATTRTRDRRGPSSPRSDTPEVFRRNAVPLAAAAATKERAKLPTRECLCLPPRGWRARTRLRRAGQTQGEESHTEAAAAVVVET